MTVNNIEFFFIYLLAIFVLQCVVMSADLKIGAFSCSSGQVCYASWASSSPYQTQVCKCSSHFVVPSFCCWAPWLCRRWSLDWCDPVHPFTALLPLLSCSVQMSLPISMRQKVAHIFFYEIEVESCQSASPHPMPFFLSAFNLFFVFILSMGEHLYIVALEDCFGHIRVAQFLNKRNHFPKRFSHLLITNR